MSQPIPASLTIGDAVIFQTLQDEVVVLNMETQQYFSLDPVGAKMWQLLVDGGNVDEVSGKLAETFAADRVTIRQDLESLIGQLMGAGLLKPA